MRRVGSRQSEAQKAYGHFIDNIGMVEDKIKEITFDERLRPGRAMQDQFEQMDWLIGELMPMLFEARLMKDTWSEDWGAGQIEGAGEMRCPDLLLDIALSTHPCRTQLPETEARVRQMRLALWLSRRFRVSRD